MTKQHLECYANIVIKNLSDIHPLDEVHSWYDIDERRGCIDEDYERIYPLLVKYRIPIHDKSFTKKLLHPFDELLKIFIMDENFLQKDINNLVTSSMYFQGLPKNCFIEERDSIIAMSDEEFTMWRMII